MPRYIDADFVRSAKNPYDEELSDYERGWNAACDAIAADAPTADVVPVVRCADCKYLNEELAVGGWDGSCRYWNTHSVTYSYFCSQGERRTDDDEIH